MPNSSPRFLMMKGKIRQKRIFLLSWIRMKKMGDVKVKDVGKLDETAEGGGSGQVVKKALQSIMKIL